uniref:Uncharacterized protein n=1 Tax=Globodera rostochiensis TaxID=31243 RepID=A0A914GXC8_GLORO
MQFLLPLFALIDDGRWRQKLWTFLKGRLDAEEPNPIKNRDFTILTFFLLIPHYERELRQFARDSVGRDWYFRHLGSGARVLVVYYECYRRRHHDCRYRLKAEELDFGEFQITLYQGHNYQMDESD